MVSGVSFSTNLVVPKFYQYLYGPNHDNLSGSCQYLPGRTWVLPLTDITMHILGRLGVSVPSKGYVFFFIK